MLCKINLAKHASVCSPEVGRKTLRVLYQSCVPSCLYHWLTVGNLDRYWWRRIHADFQQTKLSKPMRSLMKKIMSQAGGCLHFLLHKTVHFHMWFFSFFMIHAILLICVGSLLSQNLIATELVACIQQNTDRNLTDVMVSVWTFSKLPSEAWLYFFNPMCPKSEPSSFSLEHKEKQWATDLGHCVWHPYHMTGQSER